MVGRQAKADTGIEVSPFSLWRFSWIGPDKRGGLNGSVQRLLAVYLPESEIPKFFWGADLIAMPPRRALLENTLTGLLV